MQGSKLTHRFAAASAVIAMCFSSTAAAAATPRTSLAPAVSPLVALSALGSQASAAALCGTSVAGAAAAAAQAAQSGCVLPVVDTPPAAAVAEPLPPPPVAPPPVAPMGSGFGFSPLLLGLAAIAAGALVYFVLLRDKDDESPE